MRARGALERREQAELSDRARAALGARWSLGLIEEGGAETLAALPWLAEVPPLALARIAAELALPKLQPKITAKRQRQLEAAVRRIDRYADMGIGREGAGAAMVLDVCFSDGGWVHEGFTRPPRTLGGIAVIVRRIANKFRRHDKARRKRAGR